MRIATTSTAARRAAAVGADGTAAAVAAGGHRRFRRRPAAGAAGRAGNWDRNAWRMAAAGVVVDATFLRVVLLFWGGAFWNVCNV